MARGETVEVFATYLAETDQAVLIDDGSNPDENTWVPKSQITDMEDEMEEGESYSFTMTEWIATEKGLI
jgi:hypothetical protein